MMVIAPSFDEAIVEFAELLTKRMVGVELIEADLLTGADKGGVFLRWNVVHRNEKIAPVWAAARRLWRLPSFREHFAPNGWADHLSLDSFSFSSKDAPAVKIWIDWNEDGLLELSTFVPDGWYDGAERKKLREELLDALPEGFERDRWLTWRFRLPEEAATFDACAIDAVAALRQVLVPHAAGV